MSKVFYEYYRKKGKLKGVVMAIERDTYGWSLCSVKDNFDKILGLNIAYNRALKAKTMNAEEKVEYYSKVPKSLIPLLRKIDERAYKYYKDDNRR